MKSLLRIAAVAATATILSTVAYCPPTGPVLPIPDIHAAPDLLSSLQTSLDSLSGLNPSPFNMSTTSFSIEITAADETIFEYHRTAPILNSTGVETVDGDTVYRVASITKVMTVYALLQQDNLCLDDPVTKYVPGLLEAGLDWYQNVTLRMLAGQVSGTAKDYLFFDFGIILPSEIFDVLGFPEADFPSDYPTCDRAGNRRCTNDDYFDILRSAGQFWQPGQRGAYSNLAYGLLALVLEKVTGRSYVDVMRESVTEPLGLTWTGFEPPELDKAVIPLSEASTIELSISVFNGTAGLYSTPNDMAKIARSILQPSLLTPAEVNMWLKPTALLSSSGNAVGAPWEIYLPTGLLQRQPHGETTRPTEIYTKEGSIDPYGAFLAIIPEYGVAITVNTAGDDFAFANRYLLDLAVRELVPRVDELARSQAEAKYAGSYRDDNNGSMVVLTVDDGPGLRVAEWWSVTGSGRNTSVLETWALLGAEGGLTPETIEARAYPSGLGDRWQVSFNWHTDLKLFEKACEEYIHISSLQYMGLPIDEIAFQVDDDGVVKGLVVPGMRQTLVKAV